LSCTTTQPRCDLPRPVSHGADQRPRTVRPGRRVHTVDSGHRVGRTRVRQRIRDILAERGELWPWLNPTPTTSTRTSRKRPRRTNRWSSSTTCTSCIGCTGPRTRPQKAMRPAHSNEYWRGNNNPQPKKSTRFGACHWLPERATPSVWWAPTAPARAHSCEPSQGCYLRTVALCTHTDNRRSSASTQH